MEYKIKTLALGFFILFVFGGGYLYSKSLWQKARIHKGYAIETNTKLCSPKVMVSTDLTNEDNIHKCSLTITVTNHTLDALTNVLLVIPVDVGTLETISAKRVTNLPQQGADSVFSLGDISSGNTKQGMIWLYSLEKRTYTIKAQIYTNERFSTTSNPVILESM